MTAGKCRGRENTVLDCAAPGRALRVACAPQRPASWVARARACGRGRHAADRRRHAAVSRRAPSRPPPGGVARARAPHWSAPFGGPATVAERLLSLGHPSTPTRPPPPPPPLSSRSFRYCYCYITRRRNERRIRRIDSDKGCEGE